MDFIPGRGGGGGATARMVHVLMAIFLSVVATDNGKVGPQKYPKQSTGVCVCMLTRFLWASLKESVVKATNKRPRLEILERLEEETGTLTNWTRGRDLPSAGVHICKRN